MLQKKGGAAGKKIGAGSAVAEPAPDAAELGLKGAPRVSQKHLSRFYQPHQYGSLARLPLYLFPSKRDGSILKLQKISI